MSKHYYFDEVTVGIRNLKQTKEFLSLLKVHRSLHSMVRWMCSGYNEFPCVGIVLITLRIVINHRNVLNEDILTTTEEVEMIINRTPIQLLSYRMVANLSNMQYTGAIFKNDTLYEACEH